MADWSNLPRDAVEAVSKRLDNGVDYVRFRSVCTSWRSWAPKKPQFPWLLEYYAGDVALYNFPNPQLFRSQLPDGTTQGKKVCGSSRGWLCLLDGAPSISLHNPFTGAGIQLPPLTDLPITYRRHRVSKVGGDFVLQNDWETVRQEFNLVGTYLAKKVILSSDPALAPNDCAVMGLMYFGQRLFSLLPGADSWAVSPLFSEEFFDDIIYHKGRFYAVSKQRSLFVCDPRNNAEVTEIPPVDPPLGDGRSPRYVSLSTSHLVESSGELLLVASTECLRRDPDPPSYTFEVYQVDLSGGQLKLLKLENLGNRSLFLGLQSMSVSAGSFPGCRTNCIYSIEVSSTKFRTVDSDGRPTVGISLGNNIAVFDMEDGTTHFIPNSGTAHWLTPSLCS